MARTDILNKNTLTKNIKNINSNFLELYEGFNDSVKDVSIDNLSIVSETGTVNISTITTSDIDNLF